MADEQLAFGRDPDPSVPSIGGVVAETVPTGAVEPAQPQPQPQPQPASDSQQIAEGVREAVQRAQAATTSPWTTPPDAPHIKAPPLPAAVVEVDEPIPGDLIEVESGAVYGGRAGGPAAIRDTGAALRERRIPIEQLRKEETLQQAWRRLLSDLPTTELVNVVLMKRDLGGSYVSCGSRINVDLNEVRNYTSLVPYGTGSSITAQRWMLKVQPATARIDDEAAYRKFIFERIGPAPPPGWALDSPLAFAKMEIAEDDMPAIEEVVKMVMANVSGQQRQQQQQDPWGMPPAMQQMPPWMLPFLMGQMPFSAKPAAPEESAAEKLLKQLRDDAAARESKTETALKELQAQHKAEMDTVRTMLETERKDRERAEREAREAREKAERDARDANHRAELMTLTASIEALKKDIADSKAEAKNAPPPPKSGASDFLALASTLSPVVMAYLTTMQTNSASERSARADEMRAERERMLADSDRMNKVFQMLGETQINSARANAEMIQRMQDPGAMVSMTKLLNETLGGNVQLIATLAKSGILGGGGGGGEKLNIGELIGQGLQAVGDTLSSFAEMQTKKMEMAVQQGIPVTALPGAFGGVPQQPQMMPPAQPAQPMQQPPAAAAPAQPAAAPAAAAAPPGVKMLNDMVVLLRAAVAKEHDPDEVADMLGALVHAIEAYKVGQNMPNIVQFVNALKRHPLQALIANFPQAKREYLESVTKAIAERYGSGDEGEDEDEDESALAAPAGNGGSRQPQRPAGVVPAPVAAAPVPAQAPPAIQPQMDLQAGVAAPPAAVAPVVPMPGKRGRGRPPKNRTASPPAAPAATQGDSAPVVAPVPLPAPTAPEAPPSGS